MTEKEKLITEIETEIREELFRYEKIWPGWPRDIVHDAEILAEEAGEAVQAALQVVYENGSVDALKKDLIHTGAVVIRNLLYLELRK